MNILVTGAAGFIGRALCRQLPPDGNTIVGVDITKGPDKSANIVWEQADLTDGDSVAGLCEKYSPDIVIHCAGIAHQKIGAVGFAAYMRVNSEATEKLAKVAGECNPDVCFVFLSSVSVYGEDPQITQITRINSRKKAQETHNIRESGIRSQETGDRKDGGPEDGRQETGKGRREDGECRPSSDYAVSKVDAERRLCALYDEGVLKNLVILRLAPVYDREWSLNLDRRVFAPGKVAYLRFGSGMQRMSALARPNLVEFIDFLIRTPEEYVSLSQVSQLNRRKREVERDKNSTGQGLTQMNADENNIKNNRARQNNLCDRQMNILNVCDVEAYEFNRIIEVFRKSGIHPNRPVISVPLSVVWVATRIAGCLLRNKKEWVYSCYDKLACDLVFDNGRMMGTGFRVRHSLETILAADERR